VIEKKQDPVIPVKFVLSNEVRPEYAMSMLIQNTGREVVLSFFRVVLPFPNTTSPNFEVDEQEAQSLEAKCVSQIILSPEHFKDMAKAMNAHLSKLDHE
jgi:hypothetical protein